MKTLRKKLFSDKNSEKGSLALEQVLFIGAIIAMSAGVYTFYGNIETYFSAVAIPASPALPGPN